MMYQTRSSLIKFSVWMMVFFMVGWLTSYFYNDIGDFQTEVVAVDESDSQDEIDLGLFWDVKDLLDSAYVDLSKVNSEEMLYGAIDGLVDSVDDPYTVFMDPEETKEFQENMGGELEGIGAELTIENGELVIVTPFKGSPAETKGLLPNDIIYLIDGERANEMSVFDAIMAIRGEAGTTVNLTIVREGEGEPLVFDIERAKIEIDSVEWEVIDGENGKSIGYISIYQFGDKTEDEFQEAVNDIVLANVDGVILDMRNNGGGYLDTAVAVISEFASGQNKAVAVKMRDDVNNEIYYTTGDASFAGLPLVVLVNSGSASASEIVAGDLQDYETGIIMGEQTFGKGSVQTVELLSDGSSLRMTVAKWYTPSDRSIDDVGITPDITVTDVYETEEDEQLDEAISYLSGM